MLKAGLTPTGAAEQLELTAPGTEFVQLVDQTHVAGDNKLTNIGYMLAVLLLLLPAAHCKVGM